MHQVLVLTNGSFLELQKEEVKTLLSKFEVVSCRETSGVDLLKNTFGVDAALVLDPTLLFSDYVELVGEINAKSTLVYYPLSSEPELVSYSEHLAKTSFGAYQ